MAKCAKCGNELREGAKFCGKCGSPVAAAPAESSSGAMSTCPVCGNALKPNAKFCTACGTDLRDIPAQNAPGLDRNLLNVNGDYVQWNILPGQIAVKITDKELKEIKDVKGLSIQPGIRAFIITDGKVAGELEPGNYKFDETDRNSGSLFGRFVNFFKKRILGIEGAKFITVVLLRGVDFPLVNSYKNVHTADVDVDISLHFIVKVTNILDFYGNFLLDKKSVNYNSFSAFLSENVGGRLASFATGKKYAEISDSEKMIPEFLPLLEESLGSAYPYLSVQRIVTLSTKNEDMDHIHDLETELFISDLELDHLTRRNDFITRLNSENYRQELATAQSEADFLALMEKIDEKKHLTEEEKVKFAELLASQRRLRQARTAEEEAEALGEIRRSTILREGEIAALERAVQQKADVQGLTDQQILARAVLENEIELDAIRLKSEIEIGNARQDNALLRRRKTDEYEEDKRRRDNELDKEEQLTQLELLRQAQAIRMEKEEAEHNREMDKIKTQNEAELEKNKVYATMTVEQIMAINPDISPEAAAALAEKFKSQSGNDKLQFAIDQKNEMRSFMEQQMAFMRDMVSGVNKAKDEIIDAKDAELERSRADSAAHEGRYTNVMEATVNAVSRMHVPPQPGNGAKAADIACPVCGAKNPEGSKFCSDCGSAL